MTAWIRLATNGASTAANDVKMALTGLASDPPPAVPAPSDIGVIVFEAVSEDLLTLVSDASRGGLVRIVAIGASPDALGDHGPWALLDAGAADVLLTTDTAELADEVAARLARWNEVEELVRSPIVGEALAGGTPAWTSVLRSIVEIGRFSDASVLIVGESGTGKDVVARLIHEIDPRPFKGDLVSLDCLTLDPAVAGSGLPGREPDAGADPGSPDTPGLRELGAPDGGTLYLKGIADLPSALRQALLRETDDRIDRTDGSDWRKSNLRLICSTDDDASGLTSDVEDFARRITAWRCRLLPLREHRDDIPTIAEQLVRRLRPDLDDVRIDPALSDFLADREYPANVHDLLTLVKGISARHVGSGPVTVGSIPTEERPRLGALDHGWRGRDLERAMRRAVEEGAPLKVIGEAVRDTAVRIALAREGGDVRAASRRLHVATRTVASRHSVHPPRTEDVKEEPEVEPPSIIEVPESPANQPA